MIKNKAVYHIKPVTSRVRARNEPPARTILRLTGSCISREIERGCKTVKVHIYIYLERNNDDIFNDKKPKLLLCSFFSYLLFVFLCFL